MTPHTTNEELMERVAAIEREIAIIKAVAGRVSLPPSILTLLWTVLVAWIGAIIFVVRLDSQVVTLSKSVESNQQMLLRHVEQPWHAAAGEKYKNLEDRTNHLEDRLDASKH